MRQQQQKHKAHEAEIVPAAMEWQTQQQNTYETIF